MIKNFLCVCVYIQYYVMYIVILVSSSSLWCFVLVGVARSHVTFGFIVCDLFRHRVSLPAEPLVGTRGETPGARGTAALSE